MRYLLKILPVALVLLGTGCVVRPVGVGVVGPAYYARPAPPPAYAWYHRGYRY